MFLNKLYNSVFSAAVLVAVGCPGTIVSATLVLTDLTVQHDARQSHFYLALFHSE